MKKVHWVNKRKPGKGCALSFETNQKKARSSEDLNKKGEKFEVPAWQNFNFSVIQELRSRVKKYHQGLHWWLSGKESTCQCRRHGFNPWSGKSPTCHEATKPVHHYWTRALEPGSHNYWGHVLQLLRPCTLEPVLHKEKPYKEKTSHNEEQPLIAATREKPTKQRRPSTAKSKFKNK